MEADLSLMTDNTKLNNEPNSLIYKDACKLKLLAIETSKELICLNLESEFKKSNKSNIHIIFLFLISLI